MIRIDLLKKGDKICVLDEDLCGEFAFAKAEKITFICEHGFEHTRSANQLISQEDFEFNTEPPIEQISSSKNRKYPNGTDEWIVDLHLHEVVDYTRNMTNYEKVLAQLEHAKSALEDAEKKRVKKLILIHGVGKGKLKKEIHKLLNEQANINFHDADYQRFGYGATEVVFYKFTSALM